MQLSRKTWSVLAASVLAVGCNFSACGVYGSVNGAELSDKPSTNYPPAHKDDTVDTYNGVKVPDPYRWLENPQAEKTLEWIKSENQLTQAFLSDIKGRTAIHQRLSELWNYERCSVPFRLGKFLFFKKNNGLQNQDVLYVQEAGGEPRLLLDPNLLSADGTVSLTGYGVTHDGTLITYGLSKGGSDWQDWYVKDVSTGKLLDDHLKWIKNSGADWSLDGKGFYYCRYDEPPAGQELQAANYFQKVVYHRLGTPQSDDKLIYERKDEKELFFGPTVTEDGRYLVISLYHGTSPKNGIVIQNLEKQDKPTQIIATGEAMYDFIDEKDGQFYFLTDQDAPKGKIISIAADASGSYSLRKQILPQTEDTLHEVTLLHDNQLICNYIKDATSLVKIHDTNGKLLHQLILPGIGMVSGFPGLQADRTTYYQYISYADPGTIFQLDLDNFSQSEFFKPHCKFDPNAYTTEQIFYQSKDGTKIPMAISHKKGIALDGNNPTYLYGYGGFKISLLPEFRPSILEFMERGGIFAVPALRGGGEYGESWHEAGMKHKKQNVFDDFIGAAQALIDLHYTKTEKLAIGGGSNGGLLVGACMTQRPDLFAAALPAVGVMDMLRFDKYTVGWAWTQEYGSASNAEDFPVLYKYSPLHNIQKGKCYPATMITTADHDDRVVPAHSFKFAATLQAAQGCDKPVLIRIDTKAGHGMGKSMSKVIDEAADKWAFLAKELNMAN